MSGDKRKSKSPRSLAPAEKDTSNLRTKSAGAPAKGGAAEKELANLRTKSGPTSLSAASAPDDPSGWATVVGGSMDEDFDQSVDAQAEPTDPSWTAIDLDDEETDFAAAVVELQMQLKKMKAEAAKVPDLLAQSMQLTQDLDRRGDELKALYQTMAEQDLRIQELRAECTDLEDGDQSPGASNRRDSEWSCASRGETSQTWKAPSRSDSMDSINKRTSTASRGGIAKTLSKRASFLGAAANKVASLFRSSHKTAPTSSATTAPLHRLSEHSEAPDGDW